MASKSLQEDYSGGRSLKNYTGLWDPTLREEDEDNKWIIGQLSSSIAGGVKLKNLTWLEYAGTEQEYIKSMPFRFLGCKLLIHMPNDGLKETLETLVDLFHFYATKRNYLLDAERESNFVTGIISEKMLLPDRLFFPEQS
jgi:hypothetical protein